MQAGDVLFWSRIITNFSCKFLDGANCYLCALFGLQKSTIIFWWIARSARIRRQIIRHGCIKGCRSLLQYALMLLYSVSMLILELVYETPVNDLC